MAGVYEVDGEWVDVPAPLPLDRVVIGAVLNALAYTEGNQDTAATLLQISSRKLNYIIKMHIGIHHHGGTKKKVSARKGTRHSASRKVRTKNSSITVQL